MKKVLLIALMLIVILACKQDSKTINYPETLSKIFNAHGSIEAWNSYENLYFEIEKPTQNEAYNVALKSRKSLITSEHHLLGFDGENVWLNNLDTLPYKSNPKFYYNLMFYFYAMPFVLGDDGINYKEAPALVFEGKTYPGLLISYNDGIGTSPDDEYILYYNPETYNMEWLGYTVTFFSKEKAKEFHFIKYSEWQNVSGITLPKTLSWYKYENNLPTTFRNNVNFVNVKLTKEEPNEALFKVTDSTLIVK